VKESMRPTLDSRSPHVIEANKIVAFEVFNVMDEARIAKNAVLYEAGEQFLKGHKHKGKH
jgi:hypothetical protein